MGLKLGVDISAFTVFRPETAHLRGTTRLVIFPHQSQKTMQTEKPNSRISSEHMKEGIRSPTL